MPQSQTKIICLALASAVSGSVAIASAFDIEAALAQPLQVTQQNTARLFKKDYSVHPILGSRAFADTCIEEGKQAIHKRDTLLGKSQDEIIGSEGQPLIQLGYNDIWDSRKDITAHWFYYAKPRFPMRLAFSGTKCVDACILNSEQVHDLFIWRMCQINGSKKTNRPPSLAHCIIPEDGPGGKTIAEIVALYGKPQKIETSGQQTKLFYPVHPGAWCELSITNGKCDEHVSLMATSGGVPYSQMDD